MASKRIFKKQVNVLFSAFIDECFDEQFSNPKKDTKIEALVDEAVDMFDITIDEINNPDPSETTANYYQAVKGNMQERLTQLYQKLSKI
jgi:S-adenosylmethionine/arginine decarboxylase-like enzyme